MYGLAWGRGLGGSGTRQPSALPFLPGNGDLRPLQCPLCASVWDQSQSSPSAHGQEWFCSTSPWVCTYCNVLHKPKAGVDRGELWEATGWPGSMALSFCPECQPLDKYIRTPVLCPWPGLWAPALPCRNAPRISLLVLAAGRARCHLIPPLSGLGPSMSFWLQNCICGSSRLLSLVASPIRA